MATKPGIPKGTRDFSPVEMAKPKLYIRYYTRSFPPLRIQSDRNSFDGEPFYSDG